MATRMEVFKQQFFDNNGEPLSGGLLYTFAVGGATPKATYTDAAETTPQANPIVLNSRGEADSDIYGTGLYKVVLKTSAGATIWTVDSTSGFNDVSFTTLSDYGGDLEAAIAGIGATEMTLFIDQASSAIAANATIPATTKIIVLKGGSINQSTKTLTLNGPIEAGPHEVFTGTGTVAINAGGDIWVNWFGSVKTNATINDMKTMLGSTNKYRVKFSSGTWDIDASTTLTANFEAEIPHGVIFAVDTGCTLAFSGPVTAGPYNISSLVGTGTMTFAANPFIYAEWFGAIDGTADETQINLAITAASVVGCAVQLLPKTYTIGSPVVMKDKVTLRGAGAFYDGTTLDGTIINNPNNEDAFTLAGICGFEISKLCIQGNGGASGVDDGIYFDDDGSNVECMRGRVCNVILYDIGAVGVKINAATDIEFCKVYVFGLTASTACNTVGIGISDYSGTETKSQLHFMDCRVDNTIDYGVYITAGADIVFDNCVTSNVDDSDNVNTGVGVYIYGGSPARIWFNKCRILDSGLYGIEFFGDAASLEQLYFKDIDIRLVGTQADGNERAIILRQTAGFIVHNCVFENINITKTGATAPDYAFSCEATCYDNSFINIKDGTHADGTYFLFSETTDGQRIYTSSYAAPFNSVGSAASGSVAGEHIMILPTSATALATLSDYYIGQIVVLHATGDRTVDHGGAGGIVLSGAADWAMKNGDTLTLLKTAGNWLEIARSDANP